MASVPGWPVVFRGSYAVAAGLVTRDRLRGPRYRRLLPDVYCRAAADPSDLLLRSLAAYRLVEGRGVLSGYSAAVVLGAGCAPRPETPAEVTVPAVTCAAGPGWWSTAVCSATTRSCACATSSAPRRCAPRSTSPAGRTWRRR